MGRVAMGMGIHTPGHRVGYGHGAGSNVGIRVNPWILRGNLELDRGRLVGSNQHICTTRSVSQLQVAHSGEFPQAPSSLASCPSVFRNEIQDIVVKVHICTSNIDMMLTLLKVMLINGTPTDAQRYHRFPLFEFCATI